MKKQILNTIGLAAIAALLCVTCDNGLDRSPTHAGDVDRFLGRINPTDTTGGGTPPTPTTYTLNVGRNNASGGSVSRNPDKPAGYNPGENVTVTATPQPGFGFTGWSGAATGTTNPVTIKMDGNKTLTANFEWQDTMSQQPDTTYELIVNANPASGGSVSLDPDQSNYAKGATVTATATAYTGYRFTGWSDAATGTANPTTITMNGNKKLTAEFVRIYTVTFNVNGGNALTSNTATTGTDGKLASLPTPTRTNYTFKGWWTTETTGGDSVTVNRVYSQNTTIYARWEAVATPPTTYTLTMSVNPNNSGTTNPVSSQSNISAGTAVNITATPASTYNFNNWTVTSGTATFANANSATTTVTLSSNATIRANFTLKTSQSGNTFTDSRDGKNYKKVTIGTQVWMAENLNYNASGSVCYDNSDANCAKYGRLYNWTTAMGSKTSSASNPSGVQGVCPNGWHLPSDAEWTALTDVVGGASTAGKKLKATSGWNSGGNGTDEYGFSTLPGGYGSSDGSFMYAGFSGDWWSATESTASTAWRRYMYNYNENVGRNDINKIGLYSVRCVADR